MFLRLSTAKLLDESMAENAGNRISAAYRGLRYTIESQSVADLRPNLQLLSQWFSMRHVRWPRRAMTVNTRRFFFYHYTRRLFSSKLHSPFFSSELHATFFSGMMQ